MNELETFTRMSIFPDTCMDEAEADDRSQSWLLSRVLFDIIPLRLIPTILVG